ncbi:hypothetical protein U5A82_14020 [Sphingobium sp. CR2-8]|uniref:hypothetical protein n=1 Tax=Sphingobium sp. CR2-8 TaxID=1306534 RepID=UPI002DBD9C08|nr:hypothetical protein [Sphingobium sp. CR2-8]MEC3911539.1 hypothetical protein [Sphingobium sp. CR2-8]
MHEIEAPTPQTILAQYAALVEASANEAETRLKVINDIIYHILGWTHADVSVEERVSEDGNTTWADYTLKTGMTAVVIEAKKVGIPFSEVPDTRRSALRGKIMAGETGSAIIQARDYARKLATPFSVITNGNVWIIFPATRTDQVKFSDSSAIIFPSIKSVLEDDYAEFYDLLSREAVINGSLENDLLGRVENQTEERRLNRFYPRGFSRISRHSLYPLIEDAIVTAFSENIVNSDPYLLEKLYVKTPDRIRFDQRVNMHILKREGVSTKSPLRGIREKSEKEVKSLISLAGKRAKPLAMLVLGQVGAGKTTFLEHVRKITAADVFKPDNSKPYPQWFYIDFRSYSKEESSFEFIIDHLLQSISLDGFLSDYDRCVRHAYKDEMDALFRGPMHLLAGDETERKRRATEMLMADYVKKQPYVEKLLSYASNNASIFLVIDNIDQFEDDVIQSEIFSSSMAIARKVGANLICSMREATYIHHRNSPIFDAFDFDPIAIEPPKVDAVLSRRFFVAKQMLEDQSGSFTAENGAKVQVDNLARIIDMVQASVLGTSIGTLVEVLATSDIRLALRMTREFLQSGWTASGKALSIFQRTGKYVMPPHEALRAIMLGTQQQYFESHSVLANPFDSRIAKTEAQMLRLYILSAMVNMSSDLSFRYVEGSEIQKVLRNIGFGDAITMQVLSDLCRFRFIHTTSHNKPSYESNYIVSRLGGYIVRYFLSDMMFLENVMMDTFIPDENIWNELKAQTSEIYSERDVVKKVRLRKARVRAFFDYMSSLYSPLQEESSRRGVPAPWCSHPFNAATNQLESNLAKVMKSASRNYGDASSPV